ncbi:MAG: HEPN domain-containing protein [Epsilonproteobacteria bacterium]|nr:HEPN domain-containing protein [Campylobacterota bacterium]
MQSHKEWLRFAREDLLAAKTLLKVELFSSVAYHAQQAAEKALKGYLVAQKYKIIKTHDLVKLLELCMQFEGKFAQLATIAQELTPLSTKFRYPSEFDIPDQSDARTAISQAQKIITFVSQELDKSIKQTKLF